MSNFINSPEQLDEVVQSLANHPDGVRIKKLLIFACTQTWENIPSKINAVHLADLVQTLLTMTPTLEQAQTYLIEVAQSLNKATEYVLVAHQIIAQLRLIAPETAFVVPDTQQFYQATAARLSTDPQSLRIKKLLILISQKRWINDQQQLDAVEWVSLIQTIHCLAPTQDCLAQLLTSRVKKLSKVTEYTAIADQIIQVFQPYYEADSPLGETVIESSDWQATEKTVPEAAIGIDLFDLKSDLMRYTNPFRVKILLFSLLHEPFQHTPEHQSMLRNHELDELLRLAIQTHRSMNALETDLLKVTEVLDEPDEYKQVARFLIEMIKPIYLSVSLRNSWIQSFSDHPTNFAQTSFVQTTVTLENFTQPEHE